MMKLSLEKKQWALAAIAALFALAAIGLLYLFMYKPQAELAEQKARELGQEKKMLAIVQKRADGIGNATFESTLSLQKKVPVKAMEDQFVLDLEKAETISGVQIESIQFAVNGVLPAETESGEEENDTAETEEDETVENVPVPEPAVLPEGMEKLTATVTVTADKYLDYAAFLESIESEPRITQIERAVLNGQEEVTVLDEDEKTVSEPFTFETDISVYYLPVLTQLLDQLPKIDAPQPAHKEDPFVRLPAQKK